MSEIDTYRIQQIVDNGNAVQISLVEDVQTEPLSQKQLIIENVSKKLDDEIPMGSNILEAGCGTGQMSIVLSRYARQIYGIDLSKGSLIEAKQFINSNDIKSVHLFRMNIFKF